MVFDDDDDDDELWFHKCYGFKRKTNLLCVFLCMFQFFLRLYVAVGVGGVGWDGVGWGNNVNVMRSCYVAYLRTALDVTQWIFSCIF